MTQGRTTMRMSRVYIDGYDMSGYSRSYGPLSTVFEEGLDDALTVNVKGAMLGSANVSFGALNGLFDNTATSGLHVIMQGAGAQRTISATLGIQAIPAAGDPVFAGQFMQLGYYGGPNDNPVTATIPFGNTSSIAANLGYASPWGILLLPNSTKTAANTAVGIDCLAGTTKGGYMVYHALAGNGTAAIKVQHSTTTNLDGSFSDLLSTGTIDLTNPTAGIVALANPATVGRYLRWQIALGTATTLTFVLSFHRNYI
jgi:hypothetical protein